MDGRSDVWERWICRGAVRSAEGLTFGDQEPVRWNDIVRLGWTVVMDLPTDDRDYLVVVDDQRRHWWYQTANIRATLTDLLPERFGAVEDLVSGLPWQSLPSTSLIQNVVIWPASERGRPLYGVRRTRRKWLWSKIELTPAHAG